MIWLLSGVGVVAPTALLPHRRERLADGQPVGLGGRSFDVLMALIEARGAVVNKDALIAVVVFPSVPGPFPGAF